MRHVVLNLDNSIKIIDIKGEAEGLQDMYDIIGDPWVDFTIIYKDTYNIMSICVDDNGLHKNLKVNGLATGLRGIFRLQDTPLVGPAILCAADGIGESVDVPESWIDLVQNIRRVTRSA